MTVVHEINVVITDAQPINVGIQGVSYFREIDNYMIIETPSKLSVRRFKTSKSFVFSRLKVFLNGIKEKFINQISDTEFEFEIDTDNEDEIEVEYLRKIS